MLSAPAPISAKRGVLYTPRNKEPTARGRSLESRESEKDLRALVNNLSSQGHTVAKGIHGILGCSNRAAVSRSREGILPPDTALGYCVQFWWPHFKMAMEKLKRAEKRTRKIIQGLQKNARALHGSLCFKGKTDSSAGEKGSPSIGKGKPKPEKFSPAIWHLWG